MDSFHIRLSDRINIFDHNKVENLYVLESSRQVTQVNGSKNPQGAKQVKFPTVTVQSHALTIQENAKFLTSKEIARAREAKKLLQALGYPSLVDLKTIIKTNSIRDNPVTESDVKLMERLFGPDIPSVKGKTTRRRPHKIVSDVVSIPMELRDAQHNVCLCIDVMFVNGMPFLTSISKNIKYRMAMWLPTRTVNDITSLVESLLKLYQAASFRVAEVSGDQEFKPVLKALQEDGWSFKTNLASAQEHVPEAERNNRVLKERIRATYHGVPYKALPRAVLVYLVMEAAAKLNYFPAKGGCSNYFSPREILHHVKLDYKRHCLVPTLSYVLAHEEPKLSNTNRARALDCIYLRAVQNKQGGYECYHIPTRQVITRPYVTVVPTPDSIVAAVNAS